jgi:CBS domain-containing protein
MQIRELMTEFVVTASPATPVREVAVLMRERNVGSVVLVDDAGAPAGFVTDRDLTVRVLADGADAGHSTAAHASAPVITADASMTVEAATSLMARHGIRRLPVLDHGRLAGIVTLDDISARSGDAERAQRLAAQITRAALPGFYFHDRGG